MPSKKKKMPSLFPTPQDDMRLGELERKRLREKTLKLAREASTIFGNMPLPDKSALMSKLSQQCYYCRKFIREGNAETYYFKNKGKRIKNWKPTDGPAVTICTDCYYDSNRRRWYSKKFGIVEP